MTGTESVVGMVRVVRSMIQQVGDGGVDGSLRWRLSGTTIQFGDIHRPGLFADMFITDESGWQVGVSAVAAIEDWPAPADGETYSDEECRHLEGTWATRLEHVMWDVVATQARSQCAVVDAPVNVPSNTPQRISADDD